MSERMEIVVMHMSGAYLDQDFYREKGTECAGEEIEIREIDCRDVEGTRGYCDGKAAGELRERLAGLSFRGIHFLDSGNYHYLTLLWMEKITQPFSLVLFDRHPDMQRPAFGDITSCGGWVREALLAHPCLKGVYLVGVDRELLEQEGIVTGITASGERTDVPLERVHGGISGLPERGEVYLSIDKDALGRQDARCDWDQGTMTLGELLEFLDQIASRCRILGADICGENPEAGESGDSGINNRTNRVLAGKLLKCLDRTD